MKQLSILFLLLLASNAFSQNAILSVSNDKQNFGFVREGEKVNISYAITNTGDSPLIITETQVTCGCTAVDVPKTPIKPGASDTVKVVFDTKGKMDRQDRTVTIISNAQNSPTTVRFKGVVLKAKK